MNPNHISILIDLDRKISGAHYTPASLADFIATQIVDALTDLKIHDKINILDPAVGDGELLVSLLSRLGDKGYANINASGFDTNNQALNTAAARINKLFPHVSLSLQKDDFLAFTISNYDINGAPDLFSNNHMMFDTVIANPPYVRTQIMGPSKSQLLARSFNLAGRVDLYHAFIQGISRVLKPGGITGIIVSNRFMSTKAGANVRKALLESFDILHIWDLGDTRLFEAAVLPSVLLLKRKTEKRSEYKARFTSIYSTPNNATYKQYPDIISALDENGVIKIAGGNSFLVRQGNLDHGCDPMGVWHITNKNIDNWLNTVKQHSPLTFKDIGYIRVGVKTNADKIFIRSDWDKMPKNERPEILQPVITHHVARRYKAISDNPRKIIYPHTNIQGERCPIALDEFPRTKNYFNKHRSLLEKREYLIGSGRKWYEIWVPQNPGEWKLPKIVFRDITDKPTFWMDLSGAIVNGDCYWMTYKRPYDEDILWLALAIGNSTFIEKYYDYKFNNKLYAGRRRFITQYVETFPMPYPQNNLAKEITKMTKEIFRLVPSQQADRLEKEIDKIVWQVFGLDSCIQ